AVAVLPFVAGMTAGGAVTKPPVTRVILRGAGFTPSTFVRGSGAIKYRSALQYWGTRELKNSKARTPRAIKPIPDKKNPTKIPKATSSTIAKAAKNANPKSPYVARAAPARIQICSASAHPDAGGNTPAFAIIGFMSGSGGVVAFELGESFAGS